MLTLNQNLGMKKLMLLFVLFIFYGAKAQEKLNPLIKDFGTIYSVPFAEENPNPSLKYKILVDVTTASEKPEIINENLEAVAKIINLHILGGVPEKNLQVALVVHGAAAFSLMNNETYKQKYSVDNPNLPLLSVLNKAGVKIFVCGQTIFKRNIDHLQLAPEVRVALSAITTITNYSLKGFTVLKY
jgi:intracellular sulfur oxidation DsrE/DsrF family protein